MSTQYERGSFQLMKSINRSIILNMIREEGPISRAEIAKRTNLTPPTVSNLVKELIQTQFVIETNQGESKGGRKPTYLEINGDHFFVIGIDVGRYHMKFVVTNLFGTVVDRIVLEIKEHPDAEHLLIKMKEGIQTIIDQGTSDHEKYLGIGVGMHGIVDIKEGISLYAPSFQTYNIPIKDELTKEFGMMVKVENDAKTMTLGESWFGNGHEESNIVGVNVGYGIGAGVMIRGELFQGENFIAGEIGHMTIDLSGPKCSCGNYGCLQTLAGGPAIAERAVKELKLGKSSLICNLVEGDLDKVNGEVVYQAALQGDDYSIELLNQTGRYLGIGLTNLIHTINPKRIIVGGGVSKAGDFILKGITETIQQRGLTEEAKNTNIMLSKLGEDSSAIGASVLILSEFFNTKKV
ncbi:ROK family protein [Pontibacillus yanchengensis]|uniref:ROK family protein n=2 Tax=Pontibacillus yanchengensis TaxID=462910 RepID=A0A6I5A2N4_9BACI|nr:ROK family transcriptional regulator [Pontibacillus yanchengensis]MYL32149.1 ROK family protein [Pontibacillus yanchengensis]MYL52729.1 ROK family protein [Pontibacillus yanchengensis]